MVTTLSSNVIVLWDQYSIELLALPDEWWEKVRGKRKVLREGESGNDLRLICNPGWQPHSHRRAAIFHVLCRIFWRQSITTALGNQPVSLSLPLGSVQSAFLCFRVLIRIERSETRGCTDYHIKTFPFSFLAFLCVAHNIEAVWMALTLCKRRLGSTLSTIPVHLTVDYSWQQDARSYYAPHPPKTRVAKCQIFYTEQIFQTKFYPKKSA